MIDDADIPSAADEAAAAANRGLTHRRVPSGPASADKLATKRAYNTTDRQRAVRAAHAREYRKRPEVAPFIKARRRLECLRARGGKVKGVACSADWAAVEAYIMFAFNRRCCYCAKQEVTLTIDHVDAVSKGGTNDIWNLAPACGPCNSRKHVMPLETFIGVGAAKYLRAKLRALAEEIASAVSLEVPVSEKPGGAPVVRNRDVETPDLIGRYNRETSSRSLILASDKKHMLDYRKSLR